ncbi:MAG: response regulator transcription factor [Pirellulaceae bacterium]|nr:response regulator transcription factor [Pirellulaceae bacterium]
MKRNVTRTARILIVDDHPMMRDGLSAQISNEPDLEVCGEADDIELAFKLANELSPDLIIIDISLKTGHGIDLVKRLRERNSTTKMLINSMYDEAVYAERALQAGAMGYLNKQTARETLITAIRTVLDGKTYLSPAMTDRILKSRVGGMISPGKSPIESLSNRELEVLTLIGQGNRTGAIAEKLFLSVHTIDTYREKLKIKLNVANSAELNRYAAQWVLENG